jgi:hypothetical protein
MRWQAYSAWLGCRTAKRSSTAALGKPVIYRLGSDDGVTGHCRKKPLVVTAKLCATVLLRCFKLATLNGHL